MSSPHVVRWLGFSYLTGRLRRVSRLHLTILALRDWALLLFLGRARPAPAPPLAGKRIVVAKIDHLGDVLMVTPLLQELRAQAPDCTVELMLGSWCREIGEILRDEGLCDAFFFYDSFFLNKGPGGKAAKIARWLSTSREARRRLRGAGLFLDLRPFTPNTIVTARLARIPHRIGFGLRGGSCLLHQELPFDPDVPMGQLFLDALPRLGLRAAVYRKPVLPRWQAAPPAPARAGLPPRYVAIHPFSRDRDRMAEASLWAGFAEQVSQTIPLVVLGAKADLDQELAVRLAALPGVTSLIGTTSFREAAECVRHAEAFAGVDSVFAHVALAFDRPTFVFWRTGTSNRPSFPAANPWLRLAPVEDVDAGGMASSFLGFAALPA